MKLHANISEFAFLLFALAFAATEATQAQESGNPGASHIGVLEMRSVPAGRYLVTLQLDGQQQHANVEVKDDSANCMKSSDPRLIGMEGKFEPIGKGVFKIVFRGKSGYRASQLWVFRPDGSAAVREVPDRGETQTAIPVRDDSIEPPKKP